MSRRQSAHIEFDALSIEGSLLPADWLAKAAALEAPQQSSADYWIPKGLNLRDELGRYWLIAKAHWNDFQAARGHAHDANLSTAKFVSALFVQVFGAVDLKPATTPHVLDERSYPISSFALGRRLPLVIGPHDISLDVRHPRFGDLGRQRSAFGLLQDYLNAAEGALWGIASNGLALRMAHDNASLTRPAWIEADLERIFSEDRFADFSLLWLLIHASRFGQPDHSPHQCALETWREASREQGTRARDHLRLGVEDALLALGQGFLAQPENQILRQKLATGMLSPQAYFQQLLRLVYRLIFLLTIEERGLLHPQGATAEAIELYERGYSLRRLRERARRLRAYDRHYDLWQSLKPVFAGLALGQKILALPPLGGLFAADQCPDLDDSSLGNAALLRAVFRMAWLRVEGALARINWRDMGPEELGSVYESLLELVPEISTEGRAFSFAGADKSKGNTRKTSGSYYTPDTLVQELLDSALEPVVSQRLAGATDPQAALLAITVCDPACGSGHFLLAAARRLANHLARLRAQGTPSGEDYRHALRDVITHCIFGVDLNPMALELARMSLWLEAMTPDRPLGFLDHHLQCGDALLGVLDPAILNDGLPDEAFSPLTGDDKIVASAHRKLNKQERESWHRALATGDLFRRDQLAAKSDAIELLADDSLDDVAAKSAAWRAAESAVHNSRLARLADLFVGAFLLAKTKGTESGLPSSRHLWAIANEEASNDLALVEGACRAACADSRVLHWWLAFPHVAAQGGFALMVGNPPWERITLKEEEFFAARYPLIANAMNKADRGKCIELLRQGRLQQSLDGETTTQPPNEQELLLHRAFEQAKRSAEAASVFAHHGGRYPLTGVGDVNTYALFAECYSQLAGEKGRAGLIVPTGIATDDNTKVFFAHLALGGRLRSLLCLENEEFVFPSVHHAFRFALMTIGGSRTDEPAELAFFARQPYQIHDSNRRFTLTPAEFDLLNPNTRTCPIFRSQHDAAIAKKLYRNVPVLIREAVVDEKGDEVEPELNAWGLRFTTMFHMSGDSGLFHTEAGQGGVHRLRLYEAKMIHQFDHRWATYVEAYGSKDEIETVDSSDAQKADPGFAVRPRYWVDEREVLTRIAQVPRGVAKAWLAAHLAIDTNASRSSRDALRQAIGQWIAGELLRREVSPIRDVIVDSQLLQACPRVERRLQEEYSLFAAALREAKITGKKIYSDYAKWARQDSDVPLSDDELATLAYLASQPADDQSGDALCDELDVWMDRRSPRWSMGWRNITGVEKIRTVIASVFDRVGVGHSMPIWHSNKSARHQAALLGCLNSLVLDYAARQKVGGTNLTYGYMKQFPVPPPESYSEADLNFIVPRVLELTYTAHDLRHWATDLGYDGLPFSWDTERRAQLRTELDAYYARLYGLTRDEVRYILDPSEVLGAEYPSESFRVLKNSEIREYGEFRTARTVLYEFDRMTLSEAAGKAYQSLLVPAPGTTSVTMYSAQGVVQSQDEAAYAGLVLSLIRASGQRISRIELNSALAWLKEPAVARTRMTAISAGRFAELLDKFPALAMVDLGTRLTDLLQSLELAKCLRVESQGAVFCPLPDSTDPSWFVPNSDVDEVAKLLIDSVREVASVEASSTVDPAVRQRNQ